jgi:DNA-directed RNA polymerase specialized sigma subunit
MVSLVKSLRTYDPSKNDNLGAYVLQRMRWAMLEALRFWRAGNRRDTERGVFYDEVALGDVVAVLSVSSAVSTDKIDLARALEKLPPRRRQLMRAYLGCDDVAGAAASVGMSTKSGWQHHWKAVRTLRSLLATTR